MAKNNFVCDCNTIHKDVVDKVIKKIPDDNTLFKLANLYKILGDNTRVKILWTLDQNEMCVCDIANVLNMSKSSISHQLSTLRKNNIVKTRKDGKEVYYTLDDNHIKELFEVGMDHIREDL